MSKLNYLLAVFVLCLIGFVISQQLRFASQTASAQIGTEIPNLIQRQIDQVFRQLKRYPDSGNEFKTMVLDSLNLENYRRRIEIKLFTPGTRTTPALFRVDIDTPTAEKNITLNFEYYGMEYRLNPGYIGKLLLR